MTKIEQLRIAFENFLNLHQVKELLENSVESCIKITDDACCSGDLTEKSLFKALNRHCIQAFVRCQVFLKVFFERGALAFYFVNL